MKIILSRQSLIRTAIFSLLCAQCLPADAAWVTQNKKPVSAMKGMQNSVEGAITNVLPWNWSQWGKKKNG